MAEQIEVLDSNCVVGFFDPDTDFDFDPDGGLDLVPFGLTHTPGTQSDTAKYYSRKSVMARIRPTTLSDYPG